MDSDTPASRLKRARQAAGLDEQAVAKLTGITCPWYCDLEGHEDELVSTLSVEKLCELAEVVKADPLVLLIGGRANSVEQSVQFDDVVHHLVAEMAAAGLDVDPFGDRVGWDLRKILVDPQELWALNSKGFSDVATGAGVEWTSAFPRTRRACNLNAG